MGHWVTTIMATGCHGVNAHGAPPNGCHWQWYVYRCCGMNYPVSDAYESINYESINVIAESYFPNRFLSRKFDE